MPSRPAAAAVVHTEATERKLDAANERAREQLKTVAKYLAEANGLRSDLATARETITNLEKACHDANTALADEKATTRALRHTILMAIHTRPAETSEG